MEIVGKWLKVSGKVRGDQACRIIAHLVENHLILVGEREGAWTKLYLDPMTGRYWEHTYPQSYMHGAGPPALTSISKERVQELYGRVPTDPMDHLIVVGNREKRKITLLRDVTHGSYWEVTYDEEALRSGGPPCMTLVPEHRVLALYGHLPVDPL